MFEEEEWDMNNEDFDHRKRRVTMYKTSQATGSPISHDAISEIFEQEQKQAQKEAIEKQESKSLGAYQPKFLKPYLAELKELELEIDKKQQRFNEMQIEETEILDETMNEYKNEREKLDALKSKLENFEKEMRAFAEVAMRVAKMSKTKPNEKIALELQILMEGQDATKPCVIIATCKYDPLKKEWSFEAEIGSH